MTVSQTSRIINPRLAFKKQLNLEVENFERRKAARHKNCFTALTMPTINCSQCDRGMRKDIAKIQIENKRENAPICVPCILGIPRKKKEKFMKHFSKDAKNKFKNYQEIKNTQYEERKNHTKTTSILQATY